MRKMNIIGPIAGLPVPANPSVKILGSNRKRIGLIINNYGTQTVFLYDSPELVIAGTGFSVFPGFGLAMMQAGTCPQTEIYAGQAAAGGILNIIEITQDDPMTL